MTRKHYQAIAKTIHSNLERSTTGEAYRLHTLALELAVVFANENPRFDRDRFMLACGFAVLAS